MTSDFNSLQLSDIAEYTNQKISIGNLNNKTYISTENMLPNKGGIVNATTLPSVNSASAFDVGDILVSNIRPYFKKIWQATFNGGCSNDVLVFRAKENICPKFLYYVLSDDNFFNYAMSTSKGTKMPRGDKQSIMLYKVPDFDLITQQKIAKVLSAIDDKIELNNKINKNLEQQAQAIFKSWFVDFESFGGTVPDSWVATDIYSIANIIYGAPFASKRFNTIKQGKPIVRIRDLKTDQLCTYTDEIHPKGYLLKLGDIVVGMDGEFRPYLWGNDEAWLNQRVCVFENKNAIDKAFVYFTIKPLLNHVEQTEVATTVIHIGKNDFDNFNICLPERDALDKFGKITTPMIERIVNNKLENKRLASLRDTLLPKLMSGKIDVENVK